MSSVELRPYEDLKSQLGAVLSSNSTLNLNKSTGQILITANFDELRNVQLLLKKFYEIYSKTIAMDVYIYQVKLKKNNKFGVSFNSNAMSRILSSSSSLASSVALNIGGGLSSTTNPATSELSLTKNYTVPKGTDAKFNKFFLKFLNNFGDTTVLTKPKLETINTIPVSMKITQSQDYVASIDQSTISNTNTNVATTSSSTNVTKGTIQTGFTLGLYPMAERNGKIKILIKPKITQLLNITPYTYGSKTNKKIIQLITKSTKDFSQMVNIKNNEVAIISGYIYEDNTASKDALPYMDTTKDSILDPLLSTKSKSIQRNEMIIAIKARILQ